MKKTGKVLMYSGVVVIILFVLLTIFVGLTTRGGFNSSDMGMFLGIIGVGITLPVVAVLMITGASLWSWGRHREKQEL